MAKKTLAAHAADAMNEAGASRLWAGDPNLCHDAYSRAGGTRVHPLNKIKSVIDAARKSDLFKPGGYIRACDATGRREVLHPVFVLKVPTIRLVCKTCAVKVDTPRADTDPPSAVEIRGLVCPNCDTGGFDMPEFLNSQGEEVSGDPETF